MYPRFSLILMATHACNLRCSYCYVGQKSARSMPEAIGRKAIDRAMASLEPGGELQLGFFGGEPLLEADLIAGLIAYAQAQARKSDVRVSPGLTTNGTVDGTRAWRLMTLPELSLAVSCDGRSEVHDRHRRFPDGRGSSPIVLSTLRRLIEGGNECRVVMVVRPETVDSLPDGIAFLRELGIRRIEPSLDLWTRWEPEAIERLEAVVGRVAELWREALPDFGLSWLDEKIARLACGGTGDSMRCAFGNGDLAVAPSGRLYPCERLIGEDAENNPMRLPGHVLDGEDFLRPSPWPERCTSACGQCAIESICNTTCRCSNYARTGDPGRPDGLLCRWSQACAREIARLVQSPSSAS